MKNERFNELVKEHVEDMIKTLASKGEEYAREGDRLSNFKRAGEIKRCTPEQALLGIWSKHLVSLLDMIEDIDRGKEWPLYMWQEKIRDNRNYMVLLHGLIIDRKIEK